jgi:mono/diheme cytochrome c family protein
MFQSLTAMFLAASFFLCSCGQSDNKQPGATGEPAQAKPSYGKIKEVQLDPAVNAPLAAKGEKIFSVTCAACHKLDQRYVGPELGTVYKRRTPIYIMNMILDTEVMIQNDDTAKCLLQTYLTKMPNAQVNEQDARAVLEHLRNVAEKP